MLTDRDTMVWLISPVIEEQTNDITYTQRACDFNMAHIPFPTSRQPNSFVMQTMMIFPSSQRSIKQKNISENSHTSELTVLGGKLCILSFTLEDLLEWPTGN